MRTMFSVKNAGTAFKFGRHGGEQSRMNKFSAVSQNMPTFTDACYISMAAVVWLTEFTWP